MVTGFQPDLDFDAAASAAETGQALILDLDGYEGPLHVLLALAREQKVDLMQLSITQLADQYLAFVKQAQARNFALAADYLVMAAWLIYLKSRLLLPKPEKVVASDIPVQDMAGELAFRLARLESMRRASTALLARPQLARDVFVRGDPEAIKIVPSVRMEGDLFGLMTAYIEQKRLVSQKQYRPRVVTAYGLDDARRRLKSICVNLDGWTDLTSLLPQAQEAETATPASCLASMLSASLELVKEGDIDLHQEEVFSAVLLRHRGENRA